jgi:vesicle-fusing ATPase
VDAEKEQAEMGDASMLHIIIFDEMDAVMKHRGSSRGAYLIDGAKLTDGVPD